MHSLYFCLKLVFLAFQYLFVYRYGTVSVYLIISVRQKFSLSDDKVDSKSVKNDASLCSSSVCIELWVVPLFVTLSMTVCFYLMLQSLATAQVLIPPSLKSLTSSTGQCSFSDLTLGLSIYRRYSSV